MTTSALDPLGEGKPYATDGSFRARAEAQQRRYRAEVLKQPWNEYGHMLAAAAADAGKNFVHPESFRAAQVRLHSGKGVTRKRTFGNMLASQAMCFNIFGPLAQDWGLETAAKVLKRCRGIGFRTR